MMFLMSFLVLSLSFFLDGSHLHLAFSLLVEVCGNGLTWECVSHLFCCVVVVVCCLLC